MGTKESMEYGAGKSSAVGYQNVFAVLKKEHDEIMMLFKQVRRSDAPESSRTLLARLRIQLLSHIKAEEEVFYDRLERIDSARSEVRESLREHNQVEQLLNKLSTTSIGDDDWESTLDKLQKSVTRHVEEEEGKIFALAQKFIDEEEAQELGRRFQNEKNEALARLSGPSAKA